MAGVTFPRYEKKPATHAGARATGWTRTHGNTSTTSRVSRANRCPAASNVNASMGTPQTDPAAPLSAAGRGEKDRPLSPSPRDLEAADLLLQPLGCLAQAPRRPAEVARRRRDLLDPAGQLPHRLVDLPRPLGLLPHA